MAGLAARRAETRNARDRRRRGARRPRIPRPRHALPSPAPRRPRPCSLRRLAHPPFRTSTLAAVACRRRWSAAMPGSVVRTCSRMYDRPSEGLAAASVAVCSTRVTTAVTAQIGGVGGCGGKEAETPRVGAQIARRTHRASGDPQWNFDLRARRREPSRTRRPISSARRTPPPAARTLPRRRRRSARRHGPSPSGGERSDREFGGRSDRERRGGGAGAFRAPGAGGEALGGARARARAEEPARIVFGARLSPHASFFPSSHPLFGFAARKRGATRQR